MTINPENSRQPNRNPHNLFLREVMPVPSRANPMGKSMAKKIPCDRGATDAVVAAVVATVSVEVPEPLATEVGLRLQVTGRLATGVTEQVRFTALLKPFVGATVIVEVPVLPAVTDAGVSVVDAIVKSGTGAAVTVKLAAVL